MFHFQLELHCIQQLHYYLCCLLYTSYCYYRQTFRPQHLLPQYWGQLADTLPNIFPVLTITSGGGAETPVILGSIMDDDLITRRIVKRILTDRNRYCYIKILSISSTSSPPSMLPHLSESNVRFHTTYEARHNSNFYYTVINMCNGFTFYAIRSKNTVITDYILSLIHI